jgi:integral membrane protein
MMKSFLYLGRLEGLSLILLLFVAMPIKYVLGNPEWVKQLGRAHGGLFIAYILIAAMIAEKQNWDSKKLRMSWLFSCLPFGTFIFEKKYLK